jgi:hypothetical protein
MTVQQMVVMAGPRRLGLAVGSLLLAQDIQPLLVNGFDADQIKNKNTVATHFRRCRRLPRHAAPESSVRGRGPLGRRDIAPPTEEQLRLTREDKV